MEIQIQKSEELENLLNVLAGEVANANIYHRLFCDLIASIADNSNVFAQSNTFWSLTFDALQQSSLLHLCRVYDQESSSLNLPNLLDTIKANMPLFSEKEFRNRLSMNAFVDSLASSNRIPSVSEINADIAEVNCSNPIVKKLIIWRSTMIVHRGAKVSLGKNQVLIDNPISLEEFEQLLALALRIFNKYSDLFRASVQSSKIVGHDDYKSLLKFISLGLKKWEEDRAIQMFGDTKV